MQCNATTTVCQEEAMARLVRPLKQWPQFHHLCCPAVAFKHIFFPPLIVSSIVNSSCLSFHTSLVVQRGAHHISRGLRLPGSSPLLNMEQKEVSDSDAEERRSRNQKKREARRAVSWGMDLASFSAPQIKRIISAASLEPEVLDAIMLVKKLGSDVREGKRRQFNLIGKLLRDVEPDLMDALIHATKEGDLSRLQALSGKQTFISADDSEYEETEVEEEEEEEEEEEVANEYINLASRWLDGLISKDDGITKDVYSIQNVEFDRQELRKLVRKVQMIKERQAIAAADNKDDDTAIIAAKKSLNRFLHTLAKQMSS